MRRQSALDPTAHVTAFAARILANYPYRDPAGGEIEDRIFPRLYDWEPFLLHIPRTLLMRGTKIPAVTTPPQPAKCYNELTFNAGLAINRAERLYDASLLRKAVPIYTPVIMCYGPPPRLLDPTGPCSALPGFELTTTPPPHIWFYHWVDPHSQIEC